MFPRKFLRKLLMRSVGSVGRWGAVWEMGGPSTGMEQGSWAVLELRAGEGQD